MTLQRIQVISPDGEPSLASPAAAERLKGEGYTIVGDTPAVSESDKAEKAAATKPDTGTEPPLDYKAGVARLKQLDPDFKGQPKKVDLPKLLAEAEAKAAASSDPVTLDEEDVEKLSIEQVKTLLDARDIQYTDDAELETLGDLLFGWAEDASKEDLATLVEALAAILAEDAS